VQGLEGRGLQVALGFEGGVAPGSAKQFRERRARAAIRQGDRAARRLEDKKRKDLVESKNHAEALVHSTTKSLAEYGDKVSAADKSAIETAIADLKSVLEGDDAEAVKEKTNALAQASMKLGEAMYKSQAGQAEADAQRDAAGQSGDDVVDADFEEVKDDDKKV
jgi:molecular chaperone DnaK